MTSKRISKDGNVNVEWSKDLKIDRDHGPDCEIKMVRMIYKIQDDWREAAQLVYDVDDDNWSFVVNAWANGSEVLYKGGDCLYVATALQDILQDVNDTIKTYKRCHVANGDHIEEWIRQIP